MISLYQSEVGQSIKLNRSIPALIEAEELNIQEENLSEHNENV